MNFWDEIIKLEATKYYWELVWEEIRRRIIFAWKWKRISWGKTDRNKLLRNWRVFSLKFWKEFILLIPLWFFSFSIKLNRFSQKIKKREILERRTKIIYLIEFSVLKVKSSSFSEDLLDLFEKFRRSKSRI